MLLTELFDELQTAIDSDTMRKVNNIISARKSKKLSMAREDALRTDRGNVVRLSNEKR